MTTRRRRVGSLRVPGLWTRDSSGGLVPKVASALSSWTKTGGVAWNGSSVQLVGSSQSMQAAFSAPGENYELEFQANFPSAANVLTAEFLSTVGGSVRFALEISGAATTMAANGNDITPANLNVNQWVRYRVIVRPAHGDALVFAYWYDPLAPLIVWHLRLAEGGGTKLWATSGSIGAVRLRTSSGTVYVRQVSVKAVAGVRFGDSLSEMNGPSASPVQLASAYGLAPYAVGAKSGDTFATTWEIEQALDPNFTIAIIAQGTGGQTMQGTIARVQDYVLDVLDGVSDPRALLHAGTNDIAGGRTDVQVLTDTDSVLALLAGAGIGVVLDEILPRTGFNSTQDTRALAVNAGFLARQSATVRVSQFLANRPLVLKPATTFDLNPVYTSDGTHLFWEGIRYIAPEPFARWFEL